MDEFDLFAMKSKEANKTNSFVCFLGESMGRQSAFKINWPLTGEWAVRIQSEVNFDNISMAFFCENLIIKIDNSMTSKYDYDLSK